MMRTHTHRLRRLVRCIPLALAAAAAAVPTAQANSYDDRGLRSPGGTQVQTGENAYPDAFDRAVRNGVGSQAALSLNENAYPDAFDRAVRNGVGGQAALSLDENAYPDAFDRALRNGPTQIGSLDAIELIRSQPRVEVPFRGLDRIEQVRHEPRQATPPSAVSAPGFDWSDAGIGAGVAFGALLLVAAAALAVRGRSRLVHP